MKQFNKIILFFLITTFSVQAQYQSKITAQAEISIITGSPGIPLYAAFGHTAVRVKDEKTGLDILFNYGIFDFNTPNFYIKFARGKLKYSVEVFQYKSLYKVYQKEGRQMYEQVLDLTQEEKQKLYTFLLDDIQPENKFYQYDFFFDNCSTRVRDLLNKTFQEDLQWKYKGFEQDKTFRELISPYLKEKVWVDLGLNLILAQPTDKIATLKEYLFLPDYLFIALEESILKEKKIIKETNILLKKQAPVTQSIFSQWLPWILSLSFSLMGLIITAWEYSKNKEIRWIDNLWLSLTGLLGLFFLLLWFGTEHKVLPYNLNIIWASPFNLFIIFFKQTQIKWYYLIFALMNILLLIFWSFLLQSLILVLIPIIIFFIIRSIKKYYFILNNKRNL